MAAGRGRGPDRGPERRLASVHRLLQGARTCWGRLPCRLVAQRPARARGPRAVAAGHHRRSASGDRDELRRPGSEARGHSHHRLHRRLVLGAGMARGARGRSAGCRWTDGEGVQRDLYLCHRVLPALLTGEGAWLPAGDARWRSAPSHGHGFPARLVAPGKRGFEWVKWVTSIQVNESPKWLQPPLPLQ